ncbi:MAG: transporter substrate-binding domain-containing protein [Tabrizicola sp.]|nr:transporter substrate-binding domain-containing protein [Tabrizicola sp.]
MNKYLGHTAVVLCLMAGAASAQELCSVYTVQKGDTLSIIASTAGVRGGFQTIYLANSDTLASPNIIEINQKIIIPCADGTLPGKTTAAAVEQPATAAKPKEKPVEAAAELPPIRFLTGGGYAPFTDEALPGRGMFTELVEMAMKRGNPDQAYDITFVNDWDAHLTALMPSGAFDMGFPWSLPDCTKVDFLSPETQIRCLEYDASDPFFEAVVGYYTLAGSDLVTATSSEDLKNQRLCRPDGWFIFDLEARELVEPKIPVLMRAPTQTDCWTALQEGKVDVVTFDALPAQDDILRLGITDEIAEIPGLTDVTTGHVFVPKNNPNGKAYLEILNAGLKGMREDGTWFEIISLRLRQHGEKQATAD